MTLEAGFSGTAGITWEEGAPMIIGKSKDGRQ